MNLPDSATKKSANEAASEVHHNVNEAVDKVTEKAGKVVDDICEKGEKLMESQEKMLGECSSWVRSNPLTAIAMAAGAGYLLSKITR